MAGITDACFRTICKRMGAGLTYTEMISAAGLRYSFESEATRHLLQLGEGEAPVAVQLFGADPETVATQARVVARHLGEDLAFIDINMGCPVPKVIRKGEGSALMQTPELAVEIVSATVEALRGQASDGTDVPVTVKMRRGFADGDDTAVSFARAMEAAGASALAVHGRYQAQYYRGESDAATITRVAAAVDVPVIGSGDVFTAADAARMISPVSEGGIGAAGVMVARGAQGNPWIFSKTTPATTPAMAPTPHEIFAVMHEHAACVERTFGPKALVRMRRHAMWYCAGLPHASHFRRHINNITTMADLEALIDEYANAITPT